MHSRDTLSGRLKAQGSQAKSAEAQDHHCPGGGLGDGGRNRVADGYRTVNPAKRKSQGDRSMTTRGYGVRTKVEG
jgi:hypothetical protein